LCKNDLLVGAKLHLPILLDIIFNLGRIVIQFLPFKATVLSPLWKSSDFGSNQSGEKNKNQSRGPNPKQLALEHREPPGTEKGLYPDRRHLNRCPGEKESLRGKGREKGNPATAICQCIKQPMARPNQPEKKQIDKPTKRKRFQIAKENEYELNTDEQTQKRRVEESPVAENRGIRNPKIKKDCISVGQDSCCDRYRPESPRRILGSQSNADCSRSSRMRKDRRHINSTFVQSYLVKTKGTKLG
jgi:hypothetical protein